MLRLSSMLALRRRSNLRMTILSSTLKLQLRRRASSPPRAEHIHVSFCVYVRRQKVSRGTSSKKALPPYISLRRLSRRRLSTDETASRVCLPLRDAPPLLLARRAVRDRLQARRSRTRNLRCLMAGTQARIVDTGTACTDTRMGARRA